MKEFLTNYEWSLLWCWKLSVTPSNFHKKIRFILYFSPLTYLSFILPTSRTNVHQVADPIRPRTLFRARLRDDVVAAGGSLISRVRRDASSSRPESHGGTRGVGERRRPVSGMVRRWETSREVPQDWWTSSPTYSHAWLFVRTCVRAYVTWCGVPLVLGNHWSLAPHSRWMLRTSRSCLISSRHRYLARTIDRFTSKACLDGSSSSRSPLASRRDNTC